jgi:phosphoglycerate dehydrogenase-like enzyme
MVHVACLDVWAPAVRAAVQAAAPQGWTLSFADSYEPGHQQALAMRAQVLVPGFATVDENLLTAAPAVRVVHKWGIGLDAIDQQALRRRGIALAITAGGNAGPVAELAIGLMLAVYRRIPYVNQAVREGAWPTPEMRETCWQLTGKTIGLVGLGAIGRMLAHRLSGFDAHIVYHDPHPASAEDEARLGVTRMALPELLACSDIVSLHLPLLSSTRWLINAQTIASMKPGSVLINTARGGLVDEHALYEALLRGQLRGAGLDAFEQEPPPVNHPLLSLPQVVVTPHAGGGVFDNVAPVARHVFRNVQALLAGTPIPVADRVLDGATGGAA